MWKSNKQFADWRWMVGMLAGFGVLLALQYPLCLYWRLGIRNVPTVALDDETHLRFDGRRVVDWRSGRVWLDASDPTESSFIIQDSERRRIEIRRSSQRLMNDRVNYSVVYRDVASNRIENRFEFQVDKPVKRVGEKGLVTRSEEASVPSWFERVEFTPEGPIVRRVYLPASATGENFAQLVWLDDFHLARGMSHVSSSRGLPEILHQANVGPRGNVPMNWDLFRIDGEEAISIAQWQTEWSDIQTAYVEGGQIITRSLDRTSLEVRDITGQVVRKVILPWPDDSSPRNRAPSNLQLEAQGFLVHRTLLPSGSQFAEPVYSEAFYDIFTLASLRVPPAMDIRAYDRPSGCIIASSTNEVSVTWRDGNHPTFQFPFPFRADVFLKGETLVLAAAADPMMFQVYDLKTKDSKRFDWRNRRTLSFLTNFGVWVTWSVFWLTHSYRRQWSIVLDFVVIGGVVTLLHLFCAWLLQVSHWNSAAMLCVPMGWCVASSLWLVFGHWPWMPRLAAHIATLALSQYALLPFDMPIAIRLESAFVGILAPVAFLFVKGFMKLVNERVQSRTSPLRVSNFLWLMTSVAALLIVCVQLLRSYSFWRVVEDLSYLPLHYLLVEYAVLLGAIVLLYMATLGPIWHWPAVLGGGAIFVALVIGWEWKIRSLTGAPVEWTNRHQQFMLLKWICTFSALWFVMLLFRLRGWRWQWRWGLFASGS